MKNGFNLEIMYFDNTVVRKPNIMTIPVNHKVYAGTKGYCYCLIVTFCTVSDNDKRQDGICST